MIFMKETRLLCIKNQHVARFIEIVIWQVPEPVPPLIDNFMNDIE